MSLRIPFGRWTLRNLPTSRVMLAGIAVSLIVSMYYFSGWARPWLQGAIGFHVGAGGAAQVRAKRNGDDTHYLGSIILSPKRGDKCWERGLDNRNGAMWERGPVDCDVVPPLKQLQENAKGLAAQRLKAIGKAFAPKEN